MSSYALLWGDPKLEFGKVWCGCLGTNAQTWIIESFHPWALESLNAWILESLNAWVLESLNPGGFESLTLWILGSRCGNLFSYFLEIWINILWRIAVMHSALSSCVCTYTGSGALSIQASQFGKCNCFGSGGLEQERPGCKTWALLRRACTKQCGAASASLLGPLPLVLLGIPALSAS